MPRWPGADRSPATPTPAPPPVDAAAIVRRARRLRFRVRPGAVAALAGAYHSARPGAGLTFAELKPYEPGDDVRHLDWNVTARQDRPYVRRYVEERALTLRLIVDVSASMRFGTDGRTKADRAAQAAALLAAAAVRNGDRVAVALVSDRIEAELPAGGGERHLARVLRTLVATPTASRGTHLAVGLPRIQHRQRRGLIVALGDFLNPEPVPIWRRAARGHDVMALRLVDPREEQLPRARLVAVEDAETGKARIVDSGSARVRHAYARAARSRREAFRSWCVEARITGYDLSTTEDPIGPLQRIFAGRASRRGG